MTIAPKYPLKPTIPQRPSPRCLQTGQPYLALLEDSRYSSKHSKQYFPLRRVFSPLHYHPLAECTSPCQVSLGLMVDKVSWGGTQASHAHSLPPFIAFPTPPAQTRKCIIKRSRQSVNAKAVQHLPRPFVRQPVGEGADRSAAHMDPTTEWVCREVLGSNCMSGWRYGRIR